MANTIKKHARGTYTKLTHHASYHEQQRQVLCEGVLEVYQTDISAPLRFAPAHIRPASGTRTSQTARYEYQSDIRVRFPKDRAQMPHIPQPTNDTMWDWLGLMGLVVPIPGSNI